MQKKIVGKLNRNQENLVHGYTMFPFSNIALLTFVGKVMFHQKSKIHRKLFHDGQKS